MNSTSEVVSESMDDKMITRSRSAADTKPDGLYAKYVLFVLILVSALNFFDRAIMGVLVEDIKADLKLTDADMGFLGGAAFAIFYATFGMALGRLADVWNRTKLLSLGLGLWSLMTALSGYAQGMRSLALCRFGVGVGESCASPTALSIIYDYFSSKKRTRAVAIFNCGGVIGSGLGFYAAGMILDSWNAAWPDASLAPLGLKGWQAAFVIAGLPGLLVALWASTLREPVRGQSDGITNQPHARPFHEAASTLVSMIPIVNLFVLAKAKNGRKAVMINGVITLTIIVIVYSLVQLTNDRLQWIAMGIGVYAVVSWAQGLAVKDPVVFAMIFQCKTLVYLMGGMATLLFMMGALFWTVPYFQRNYGVSASEMGAILGGGGAITGIIGVLVGGALADRLRAHTSSGKLYVLLAGMVGSVFCYFILLTAKQLYFAYAAYFLFSLSFSLTIPTVLSTLNDLVLPRSRATISAFYVMLVTLSGPALSPYIVGSISDAIVTTGVSSGEALRQSMLWAIVAPVVGIALIVLSIRHIEFDEARVLDRARALGEPI